MYLIHFQEASALSSMLMAAGIKKIEKHPSEKENILLDFS